MSGPGKCGDCLPHVYFFSCVHEERKFRLVYLIAPTPTYHIYIYIYIYIALQCRSSMSSNATQSIIKTDRQMDEGMHPPLP